MYQVRGVLANIDTPFKKDVGERRVQACRDDDRTYVVHGSDQRIEKLYALLRNLQVGRE